MSVEEFLTTLEEAAQRYALDVQILARTHNSVKTRIDINESLAIQCYYNQRSITRDHKQRILCWSDGPAGCTGGIQWEVHGTAILLRILMHMIVLMTERCRLGPSNFSMKSLRSSSVKDCSPRQL